MASKYRNVKTSNCYGTFDSKYEAMCAMELKGLEKKGLIKNLEFQVPFELVPKTTHNGKNIQATKYILDFVFEEKQGDKWVKIAADAKGLRTQSYIIKMKLFIHKYGNLYAFREM